MVENETLKKEVNKLTHTLAKVYGGDTTTQMILRDTPPPEATEAGTYFCPSR